METQESDYPVKHPTWEKDVRHMFSAFDIEKMAAYNILLDQHSDVKSMAPKIYQRVASGDMPRVEARWTPEKVATFFNWMNDGCP